LIILRIGSGNEFSAAEISEDKNKKAKAKS
jgi:hypothetical protein